MTAPENQPLRLAIIGCGAVAAIHHLPAAMACAGVEVTVLVDRDRERAAALAGKFGVPGVATSVAAALPLVDAAIVTVPNPLHSQVACELLAGGAHVLVEKPMASSTAECDAMLAAAATAQRVLAVGLEFRFFDATVLVSELLASAVVGPLRSFDLRLGVISRWPFVSDHFLKPGGGVLADYGTHLLDVLLAWLGDLEVLSYRDDLLGGVESDCEMLLRTGAGVDGFAEISRTRNLRNSVRFVGERGVLEVDLWDPDPTVSLALSGCSMALAGRARVGVAGDRRGATEAARDFPTIFRRQLDDFVGAIRRGGAPRVPGAEGRRSVALIESCLLVRQPLALPWLTLPKPGGGR
jgi:predicted dehydrogenase